MAKSEYEYVRFFETNDALPLSNWIVIRIDGRGFSKFTKKYNFAKPNDDRGLALMNSAALEVSKSIVDIVLAYGQSDEYSFVLHEDSTLFDRRASKLATTLATSFTAEYCMQWAHFFPDVELTRPWPTFDGRCVAYPKKRILRDYLSWRQADCHVNNLYNITFWNLVLKGGMSNADAELSLKGTLSGDKNEILFKQFGINYNNEPELYRKGTVVYRSYDAQDNDGRVESGKLGSSAPQAAGVIPSRSRLDKERKRKQKAAIVVEHCDIIGDAFWQAHPYLLGARQDENE